MEKWRQELLDNPPASITQFDDWEYIIKYELDSVGGLPGERNPMFGKKHTEEAKQKVSNANKGHKYRVGMKHSDEAKQKMREARLGTSSWNKGISMSEESKQKLSNTKKSTEYKNKSGSYVWKVCIDDEEFEVTNLKEFAAERGISYYIARKHATKLKPARMKF